MKRAWYLLGFCLLTGWAGADTLKLKNGTVLTGEITAENPTNISIEISVAGGSIMSTTIVPASNIVEITRLTPVQKHETALQREVARLQAYTLNSNVSYAVEYYDRVIVSVFRKFLRTYPGSPYTAEGNTHIQEWQAERDQVAAGQIRYNGDWMSKADFNKYHLWDHVSALLREGEQFTKLQSWSQAAHRYDQILLLNPGGGTEIAAKRQLAESLDAWRAALVQEQRMPALSRQRAAVIPRELDEITQIRNRHGLTDERAEHPATTAPIPDTTHDGPKEMNSAIAAWFNEYWLMLVGIALVGLLILTRLFR